MLPVTLFLTALLSWLRGVSVWTAFCKSLQTMKPSVFDYRSGGAFLKDMVQYLREQGKYSNRQFAKAAGFATHSVIPMILSGSRAITIESAKKISKALELSSEEKEFFLVIVSLDNSKSLREKQFYTERLVRALNRIELKDARVQDDFYRNRLFPLIYHFVPRKWARINKSQLSLAIGEPVHSIDEALQGLVGLKMIQEKQGQFRKLESGYRVDDQVHLAKLEFVKSTLSQQEEDRQLYSVFLQVEPKRVSELRKRIQNFLSELQELYLSRNPQNKTHYLLNLDLIFQGNFEGCIESDPDFGEEFSEITRVD